MRGEYACRAACLAGMWELPPRARRIQHMKCFTAKVLGTTSACAENTGLKYFREIDPGNYLRVRGEYAGPIGVANHEWELPPRARRILRPGNLCKHLHGTTSACAENTMRLRMIWGMVWNYLRVRGEYPLIPWPGGCASELPPRARRIPQRASNCQKLRGTTSACAENTVF